MLAPLALRAPGACTRWLAPVALLSGLATCAAPPARATTAPTDFVVENAAPTAGFINPVAIAFTPDGRLLVAEKRGVIRVVRNGVRFPQPMWGGEQEVLNNGDRGLLGIAVDPHYTTNHFVYLLYVVDPDSNGVDDEDDSFGRLTRYRTSAADSNVLDPTTREVLIGTTWGNAFVSGGSSHAVGALRWGEDGSLFVSWGDGAQYTEPDPGGRDPSLFLPGRFDSLLDIGAFRAQYLSCMNGKILRVNPENGQGYSSNPFFDGDPASERSRVWVYGCRNPFRYCVRPGTGAVDPALGDPGTLYIGDVGWNHWDELDVSPRGGENWGWPCYEGPSSVIGYQEAWPSHHGCWSLGTPENPALPSQPTLIVSLDNPAQSVPPGLSGNCIIAGAFYTGTGYPTDYRGRFFFADFALNWIKVATFDSSERLVQVSDFGTDAGGPVDFAVDPLSGDVHFVSITTGMVSRIRYTGTVQNNRSPIAVAAASPSVGTAPLAVSFSCAGSGDPDLDPLGFVWNFGDGNASTEPDPQHTYAQAGHYQVVLTVTDGRGGLARDTVAIVATTGAGFPTTVILDDFERPDGPLAGAWVGSTSGLRIVGGALTQTSTSSYAIWDGRVLAPDQEVYARFDAVTDSAEHSLLLKVQGRTWQDGTIQVNYHTKYRGAIVLTYDRASGWKRIGGPYLMNLGPGDRLGGRAFANGVVEVYRNATRVGSTNVGTWPFAAAGGRAGMILTRATATRMAEFGGGDLVFQVNTPPRAIVLGPTSRTFYAAGDTIRLAGTGTDLEDPADSLRYRWEVDLHHNNHIHPAVVGLDGASTFFIAEDHDDGTGVWMRARFIATDRSGASDTSAVELYPEIDLAAVAVGSVPAEPGTAAPAEYRFAIRNQGRMPAPVSRWRLIADARLLAEGDTLIPANGYVFISRIVAPILAEGPHDLRIAIDTLGAVVETDETNNAAVTRLMVVPGAGVLDAGSPPRTLGLSPPFPNPSTTGVRFALELPYGAIVEFALYDIQGREVWRAPPRAHPPGRRELRWNGRTALGERAHAGLYLARVRAGDHEFVRRLVVAR